MDVFYDLLNWESDIFLRGFWKTASGVFKETGGVVYETEGPNKDCWVVKMGTGVYQTKEGVRSEDKVLVRSNGTVVYTGKDIAYQMWKFGVLGQDFTYKQWGVQANGEETDHRSRWRRDGPIRPRREGHQRDRRPPELPAAGRLRLPQEARL